MQEPRSSGSDLLYHSSLSIGVRLDLPLHRPKVAVPGRHLHALLKVFACLPNAIWSMTWIDR
jgi:hypothetical protein